MGLMKYFLNRNGHVLRFKAEGNSVYMDMVCEDLRHMQRYEPFTQTFVVRLEGVVQRDKPIFTQDSSGQLTEILLSVGVGKINGDAIAVYGDGAVIVVAIALGLPVYDGYAVAERTVAENPIACRFVEILSCVHPRAQIAKNLSLIR